MDMMICLCALCDTVLSVNWQCVDLSFKYQWTCASQLGHSWHPLLNVLMFVKRKQLTDVLL